MDSATWKPIKGYENLYEISSDGRVRSLFRYKRELKPMVSNSGYLRVDLFKNHERKQFSIHRLVAEAFCEKPIGCDVVNHKDECKTNNVFSNLEWISHKDNCNYGTAISRRVLNTDYSKRKNNNRNQIEACSKPIIALFKNGGFIGEYESITKCAETLGLKASSISKVCTNKRNSLYGMKFKFREE